MDRMAPAGVGLAGLLLWLTGGPTLPAAELRLPATRTAPAIDLAPANPFKAARRDVGNPRQPGLFAPSHPAMTPASAVVRQRTAMGAVAWEPLAASAEGRTIEFTRLGEGRLQVLLIGPLAGDDVRGADLTDRVAAHLARFPRRLAGTTVAIVRDPNPDGRARQIEANARGVHLDQNFPTADWRKVPAGQRWSSGREPQSEPETRALVDLLDDLRPDRIVLVGSSHRPSIGYMGEAAELARKVGLEASLRVVPLDPAAHPGSLAAYAGRQREASILQLGLAARGSLDEAWSNYKRALLAAIGADPSESDEAATGSVAAMPSRQPHETNEPPRLPSMQHSAGSPLAARATNAPQPPRGAAERGVESRRLSFDELARGGRTVAVVSPRAAKAPQPLAGQPRLPRAGSGRSNGRAAKIPFFLRTRLQRLPPVDPLRHPPRDLPQQPIPLYPETGS